MANYPIYYEWYDTNPMTFPLPGPSRLVVIHQNFQDDPRDNLCFIHSDVNDFPSTTDLKDILDTVNPYLSDAEAHLELDSDGCLCLSDHSDFTSTKCQSIARLYNRAKNNDKTTETIKNDNLCPDCEPTAFFVYERWITSRHFPYVTKDESVTVHRFFDINLALDFLKNEIRHNTNLEYALSRKLPHSITQNNYTIIIH